MQAPQVFCYVEALDLKRNFVIFVVYQKKELLQKYLFPNFYKFYQEMK